MSRPEYIKTSPAVMQLLRRVMAEEKKLAEVQSPKGLQALFPALRPKTCKGYAELG